MTTELTLSAALRCHGCGAELAASRVDLASRLASCAKCGRVFTVSVGAASASRQRVIPDAFEVLGTEAQPRGVYRDGAPALRAWRYRWFRWTGAVTLVVGVVFAGFSLVAVGGAISHEGAPGLFMLLLPHLWVGVGLLYVGLANALNRTRITVDASSIRAVNGPIPWKNVSIPRAGAIGADHLVSLAQRSGQSAFQVRIIGPDRRATKLVGGLTEEEARYLAEELDATLAAP